MNRTERLYALVEELRAVSPRPRTAAWLARRFEVTTRTVERDLEALRQAGVPVRSTVGRAGGHALDRDRTLAPLGLTASEALAAAVALRAAASSPFAEAARSAARKVAGVLPADVRAREEALTAQVHLVGPEEEPSPYAGVVAEAVLSGRVLRLHYRDAGGRETQREVEPLGLLRGPDDWYLAGWCRLRAGVRGFALRRTTLAELTDEQAPERAAALADELQRIDARPLLDE